MTYLIFEVLRFFLKLIFQALSSIIMWFVPASKKDVSNEIVLITGAGSGIGRLMALRFASLGSTVVCIDINKQANEATVNEIQSKGQKAFSFTCDCSNRDDIYRIANEVKENVGDVTVLINNAGIVSGKKFLDCSDGLIQKTFEVNTLAHCWVRNNSIFNRIYYAYYFILCSMILNKLVYKGDFYWLISAGTVFIVQLCIITCVKSSLVEHVAIFVMSTINFAFN